MLQFTSTKHAAARGLNILVYGSSGAGKTTLLGTTGDPEGTVILSAEAGLLPLRHLDLRVIEIDNLERLREALAWLRRPDANVRWVCVDSLSEIAERVLTAEKQRQRDPRKAYGEMAESIVQAVKELRDLQMNVVVIAKRAVTEDGDRKVGCILMPGQKLKEALPYELDIVAELRVVRDESGSIVRWLQTEADGYGDAKDRSGALAPAEPPDLAALAAKVAAVAPRSAASSQAPVQQPQTQAAPTVRQRIDAAIVWLQQHGALHVSDEVFHAIAPGKRIEALTDEEAGKILRELGLAAKDIRAREAAGNGAEAGL